jgi:hypothetical protein
MAPVSQLNELLDKIKSDNEVAEAIREREAEALHSVLARLWLYPPKGLDLDELVLVDRSEQIRTGRNSSFRVTNRLVFHLEGRLSRQFAVSRFDKSGHSFEIEDADFDLDFEAAIAMFGFEPICEGLLKQLERIHSTMSTEEYESRLERANLALEVLQGALKIETVIS